MRPSFAPRVGREIAILVASVVVFSVASYVAVPMVPVPITAQTYALLTVAGLLGVRRSVAAVFAWLALGAAGLPVLAGGTSGLERFTGPTAGYLYAFAVAAGAVGWLSERGWNASRPGRAFASMLIGHAICLTLGAAWLAGAVGPGPALVDGLVPFLPGALIKSALAVATLAGVRLFRSRQWR